MNKTLYLLAGALSFFGGYYMYQTTYASSYIPLEVLFGNPEKIHMRISPDGTKLAYLQAVDTILNIWVQDLTTNETNCVTNDQTRPITSFIWQKDSQHILYSQDKNGDENEIIYQTNIKTKKTICLTPGDGIQVRILAYEKTHPNELVIGINQRDKALHDAYLLDLTTHQKTLLQESPANLDSWFFNHDLQVLGRKISTDQGFELQYKDHETWHTFCFLELDEPISSSFLACSKDNQTIYYLATEGKDTTQLMSFNIKKKIKRSIANIENHDISSVIFNPETYEPVAIYYEEGKGKYLFLDQIYKEHYDELSKISKGSVRVVSVDRTNTVWIAAYQQDISCPIYYVYNTSTKQASFLCNSYPELNNYTLCPTEPIQFTSRDELTIHGFITYPSQSKDKKVPLVILVHGGPWVQDVWGFNQTVQWLANRGYACLQINFRISTGYGKKFLRAGFKQWSKAMHNDILDGVLWAKQSGRITDKIGIFGGSYGGYEVLVALAYTPEVFACGVDIVGPSSLFTLLASVPAYWKNMMNFMYHAIGHPETDKELLHACSPLYKAANITKPLLIAQGAHDPRVTKAESDQIVAELIKHNIEHTYLVFENEGHGFAHPENRLTFYNAAEKFLEKHLQ